MKKQLLILLTLITLSTYSQNYFDKTKEYHYQVVYLSGDDTLTNEKMILKPLGRRWGFQPWQQVAFKYFYFPDSINFINYVDPEPFFDEKNKSYIEKKGEPRLSIKETTGGVDDSIEFFLHPPRRNQYRMLSTAIYPTIMKQALSSDTIMKYQSNLTTYGANGVVYKMMYKTIPIHHYKFNNEDIGTCWKIIGESFVGDEVQTSFVSFYNVEYGFIKLYYTLENEVKINFDLIEVKKDLI